MTFLPALARRRALPAAMCCTDGRKVATLDLYAKKAKTAAIVWTGSFAPGNHTLTITLTGAKNAKSRDTRVNLEALLVLR